MDNQGKAGWQFTSHYTNLPEKFFSLVEPNPVRAPELILLNEAFARELGLNEEVLKDDDVALLAGNRMPADAHPIAQAYAGHQFGHFTMLGDGRAMLLGEHRMPSGTLVDIQLKGSGRTPYSRGGDGRAAIGPMLREYIMCEAMYHLGIPTTRALAVVKTGEGIMRESILEGAILTRVATSHLRVGTFQYAYQFGTDIDLTALVHYALEIDGLETEHLENPALTLLENVIARQANLIAKWQLVGFVHGVMNTDNMTISGETIDYGPCAFIDTYIPSTVFSSIDVNGRYAYDQQPIIAEWNLARFAETLLPLINDDEDEAIKFATEALHKFRELYAEYWLSGTRKKLGIHEEEAGDEQLIGELLSLMETYKADYTNTFLALTYERFEGEALFATEAFSIWYEKWKVRVNWACCSEEVILYMKQHNPAMIPRNSFVEEAIHAAVEHNDYTQVKELIRACETPYAHTSLQKKFLTPPKHDEPFQTYCGT